MEVTNGRGYVYSIQYHMVWCVKYRHKILEGQVETRLLEILQQIAKDNDFQILEINTDKDHIHLLVSCSPQHYIPNMMKALKGVSARLLMKEFGDSLRKKLWGGHLWNPSYFVATSGIMALMPSTLPRLLSSVTSVSQALKQASLAAEPKKVITQSMIIVRETPTAAAEATAGNSAWITSRRIKLKLQMVIPQRI